MGPALVCTHIHPFTDEVGFELVDQRTDMSTEDFYNKPDKITDVYYKEIAAAIVEATGAAHCKIIHHQV